VATRWSSDYAMAIRALELWIPLTRLFADIETQGVGGKWSDFLANRLKPEEWQVITALQRVLKHFDITYKYLQGDPASTHFRLTCGRFDEYYSVIETLFNHLKNAIQGFIIKDFKDFSNPGIIQINVFKDLLIFL
jgi:hypothetical protein